MARLLVGDIDKQFLYQFPYMELCAKNGLLIRNASVFPFFADGETSGGGVRGGGAASSADGAARGGTDPRRRPFATVSVPEFGWMMDRRV